MRLIHALQIIAAFNFFLIGGLILLNRSRVTYGVKLLSIFLIAKGITLSTNMVFALQWPVPMSLTYILSSALFLYTPFLYFFARYLINKDVLNFKKDRIHFIPFIGYLIFNVVYLISPFENVIADHVITAAYYIQSISYTIAAFLLLRKKGNGSSSHIWLKNLLLSFLIVWISFLMQIVFSLTGLNNLAILGKYMGVISILVLANLTLIIAVFSPDIFFKGLRVVKKSVQEQTFITKENYQTIWNLMMNQELYSNPNFKLVDLANASGFSERNTSLIIKTYHEGNFIDFVNSFRIEAAKQLFIDQQDSLTISEVLYEVGFNSKSVFNTLFKKKEGMTPSQFKKTHSSITSAG